MIVDGAQVTGRRTLDADVCVVGSGAGGGAVAAVLAEAGARVVVLEEGGHHPPETLTGRPRDMLTRLYRDAGQTMTLGNPPVLLPLGRAVGGTTLVNSGTCFRAPDHVLARWSRELGVDGPGLAPFYAQVEEAIGVAPVPAALAGRNAAVARRGAEALGWSSGFLRRNARGCRGTGVCAWGCPSGAKQHAGTAWIPRALAAGAQVYARTRVTRVRAGGRPSRATSVSARTAGGGRLIVRAERLVLAAGTVHTPLLLAASGLGNPAHLGRHLTVHPATAAWARMDDEVGMNRGVPQSFYVDEFSADGIMLEGIAGPADYVAMGIPFSGDRHRELMLDYRRLAQFGLMVSDTTSGRVCVGRAARATGRPLIRYDVDAAGRARIRRGLELLRTLFTAAGAREVILPDPRKLLGFHPLGTARMSERPGGGVTDPFGRVHGTENVHVADGSAVPTALGVNPQLTIMAHAVRLGHHLTKETR